MGNVAKYRLDNDEEIYFEYVEPKSDSYSQISRSLTQDEAPKRFSDALKSIRPAADQVIDQLKKLGHQPDEIELGFGIKFSGSRGTIITSTKSDANFTIKMKWKKLEPSLLRLATGGVLSLWRLKESAPPAAWAFAILLPLLAVHYGSGYFQFQFYYLAIPIAAWFGNKFGRGGFNAFAVIMGLFSIFHTANFAGLWFAFYADLYLFSLGVAWLFAHQETWIDQMRRIEVSPVTLLAGLLFGSVYFGFAGPFGTLLIPSFSFTLVACIVAVVVGFNAKHLRPYRYTTLVCTVIGATMSMLEVGKYSHNLGSGIKYIGEFTFDGLNDFVLVMVCLSVGRMLQRVFLDNGRHGFEPSIPIGFLLALLWFYALHSIVITQGHGITLAGSSFTLLAVSFIVGIAWPGRKGLLMFGALMTVAIAESTMTNLGLGLKGFGYNLAEGVQFRLSWPGGLESRYNLFLSCFAYFYFGRRIARAIPHPDGEGTDSAEQSNIDTSSHVPYGKGA